MQDCAPILAAAREEVMRQYGGAIGQRREEVITPALVLDVDAAQRNIGQMVPGFEHSLTIQASVISRQSGKVIVDAGSKSVAAPADVTIIGHPEKVVRFDEEHGIFAATGDTVLAVGDSVALVPGYSPCTVNYYDAFHVVSGGEVVDVWPVIPRGPGHHGLAGLGIQGGLAGLG